MLNIEQKINKQIKKLTKNGMKWDGPSRSQMPLVSTTMNNTQGTNEVNQSPIASHDMMNKTYAFSQNKDDRLGFHI